VKGGIVDARDVAVTFDPHRLVTARELLGYSQVDAAREVGALTPAPLTSASISQFEKGHVRPSAATLERLAEALQVPVSFFAARTRSAASERINEERAYERAFFRSLRSSAVSDRRRARALTELVHLLVLELQEIVELPPFDVPEHPARDERAAEEAADLVRRAWQVPDGPIPDVVHLLERHGIVAARFRVATDKVDAFNIPYPDRPVVVLGADKGHRDRSRFDVAHELGHIVLHRQLEPGDKALEQQAHQFAAAFLLPARDIEHQLPRKADWGRLVELKREWHVSIAALLKRAHTLDVMRDDDYTRAMKALSARGWRRQEPADLGAPELPRLLAAALRVAAEAGSPLEELASRGGLPVDTLRRLLGPSINPKPSVRI
jgi:Zn-dependent peptidase ImmA (M78 family)/transcriptional regulator with XRE-family HTH domain